MQAPVLFTGGITGLELVGLVMVLTGFGFALLWLLISYLLSRLAGWSRLAKRYASDDPPPDTLQSGIWGLMGITRYQFLLKVGLEPGALYLGMSKLFLVGHRPLRIPWDQVRYEGPCRGRMEEPTSLLLGPDQVRLVVPAAVLAGRPPGTLEGLDS